MARDQMISGKVLGAVMRPLRRASAAVCVTLASITGFASGQEASTMQTDRIVVFAAASLADVLEETGEVFAPDGVPEIVYSFAGSAALARQIQLGAPADLFLSAAPAWTNTLNDAGLVEDGGTVNLLGNALVLVEPAATNGPTMPAERAPALDGTFPVGAKLDEGRLALALVDAVPAGIYAQAALASLGLWESVEGRLAQTDNVRAALALVAIGAAPLGIVYATDAKAEPRVRVVAHIPPEHHQPIVYPMVDLARRDTAAENAYFDFLTGPVAAEIFVRHGFATLRAAP